MSVQDMRFHGWAALNNGSISALGAAFLLVFFLAGEPHGTLSNATSLPGALTWLPIVLLLTLSDLTQPSPSRTVATAAGILGPTGISIVQSLLILKISSI